MMKRILRYRPSPATAIALTALIVAVGGVAYATIPDSSGTIHGCFQKRGGDLRVVESASDCRSSEQTISWNAGGESGVRVVTRISSERPVTVHGDETVRIPLSGSTWRQEAGEFQEIHEQVEQEGSTCVGEGEIQISNPFLNSPGNTRFDVIPNAERTVLFVEPFQLAVPDEPVEHSLNIDVRRRSFCNEGESVTIRSVEMMVIGYR
jgi:hypothetical protein